MYASAVALEFLEDKFEQIVGEPSDGPADLDIMNIIFNAYPVAERDAFADYVDQYCHEYASDLRAEILGHQPGSEGYSESRDWLFTQPEVIAILERARNREYMLVHAIDGTDLEESVRKACSAVGIVLPSSN